MPYDAKAALARIRARKADPEKVLSAIPAIPAIPQPDPKPEIAGIAEIATGQLSEVEPDAPDSDKLEERAAIIAEGSGCPIEWAEGLALLDPDRPPGDVPQDYWMAFCDTAGAFVDRWAAKAAALGWTVEEVFGCDRHAPFARLDRRGLVWALVGCTLVDLTKIEAVIEMPSGNRLKHRRRGSDGEPARAALAWDSLQKGDERDDHSSRTDSRGTDHQGA